jgi:hypothetical protein
VRANFTHLLGCFLLRTIIGKVPAKIRDKLKPTGFSDGAQAASAGVLSPQLGDVGKVGVAPVDADYKLSLLLAQMNHWDDQADRRADPRVSNKQPTHSFDLASEVQKERTLFKWRIDFRNQKVMGVVVNSVDCERHVS